MLERMFEDVIGRLSHPAAQVNQAQTARKIFWDTPIKHGASCPYGMSGKCVQPSAYRLVRLGVPVAVPARASKNPPRQLPHPLRGAYGFALPNYPRGTGEESRTETRL